MTAQTEHTVPAADIQAAADAHVRRLVYAAATEQLTALGYLLAALAEMPEADLKQVLADAGSGARHAGRRSAQALAVWHSNLGALAWAMATGRGIDPHGLGTEPEVGAYL